MQTNNKFSVFIHSINFNLDEIPSICSYMENHQTYNRQLFIINFMWRRAFPEAQHHHHHRDDHQQQFYSVRDFSSIRE
jgi:hypothetical protein